MNPRDESKSEPETVGSTSIFGEPVPVGPAGTPGELLKGRYRIQRELGRGSFGVAYLALDEQLHSRRVVVKILQESWKGSTGWSRRRFRQEVEALARIDHPGVVGVLDTGETADGRPFLVMQYVDGVTLGTLIRSGGMELARAARLLGQISSALDAAHDQDVHHRDLKPENIMLQALAAGEEQAKLIDFGVAAVRRPAAAPLMTTSVAGTPAYMAPEQLMGHASAASDIYSLGVIAYEMVTGRLPFSAGSPVVLFRLQSEGLQTKPRELRPDLTPAAEAVIVKALAFDPKRRHRRPRDFGRELVQALAASVAHRLPVVPGVESRLGPLVAKMCDRRPQEDEFRRFFLLNVERRPGAPHIYVIHGEEGECHESLVERLLYWTESFAHARYGEHKASIKLKRIPWQYDDAWEVRKNRLLSWLFEHFAPAGGQRFEDLSARAFTGLVARSLSALSVIQHDIRAARWDRAADQLLAAYLSFWGELEDDPSRPQILIFLNVIYPSPRRTPGWFRQRWARRRIQRRLPELVRLAHCPCLVLNELQPVTRDDVMEWFSLHNIYDSEEVRLRALERVFQAGARPAGHKSMAEIELQLREIHRDFAIERGYL